MSKWQIHIMGLISTADCKSLVTSKLNVENHNWFIVFEQRGRAYWGGKDSYVVKQLWFSTVPLVETFAICCTMCSWKSHMQLQSTCIQLFDACQLQQTLTKHCLTDIQSLVCFHTVNSNMHRLRWSYSDSRAGLLTVHIQLWPCAVITHIQCFFKAVVIIGSNKVVCTFRLIATKKFNVSLNHMRGRDNLLFAHRSEVCA